jgi:segregation and condensation protein A
MAENGNGEYQVNIPLFEGPLDLLLHLVTKNRIDIHDIPIHLITDQYLAYLDRAKEFNLELGSSFFAMASTLILIKSRMLLPKKRQEEVDDSEDPRQELSRSLEEFKKMKEIRARIEYLMDEERPYRTREPEVFKSGAYRGRISLARLQAAFFSLYDSIHQEEERWLPSEEVSLDEEISRWREALRKGTVSFTEYLKKKKTRLQLAVAFLALLELIRLGQARIMDSAGGFIVQGGSL